MHALVALAGKSSWFMLCDAAACSESAPLRNDDDAGWLSGERPSTVLCEGDGEPGFDLFEFQKPSATEGVDYGAQAREGADAHTA